MVKNRALKRDARVIKASTGITYPRARDLLVDPVDQEILVPSLLVGYGADGSNIVHRPGKGTILVIGGGAGTGKSLLMNRLAAEASDVASVYVIDAAKQGSGYREIRGVLSALETTAAGAMARVRSLAEPRHTAALLVIDEIGFTDDIPGFRDALQALSDSGMPIIIGGQLPHRSLPAALMARADRMLIGRAASTARQTMLRDPDAPVLSGKYEAVYDTSGGSVRVILPPAGQVPEPEYRFEFGVDSAGLTAAFTPAKDMHLVVTGCPGAGKTWFLHSLAAHAVKSMDVHFVNAAFPDEEIRTPAAVHTVTTLSDAAELLDGITQEIAVRQWRCQEAGADRISELPEPPRPVLIILDEFQWLTYNDPFAIQAAERSPEARGQRARIAAAVGKIAREGRAAGVSLVISSQEPDLRGLVPGPDNIMANLSQLVLGGADYGFRHLTAGLQDPTLQALRPGTRQSIYAPLSGAGGLVDIVLP